MHKRIGILFVKLILLITFLMNKSAIAITQTAYGTITSQITVEDSCTISTNSLSFGNYTGAVLNGTTSTAVTCTNTTPYQIGLSAGNGASATVSVRKMTLNSNLLTYSLYQDAARTIVWGNTQGADTVNGTGTGTQQTITIYGKIPASQTSPIGNYADTIVETIYF